MLCWPFVLCSHILCVSFTLYFNCIMSLFLSLSISLSLSLSLTPTHSHIIYKSSFQNVLTSVSLTTPSRTTTFTVFRPLTFQPMAHTTTPYVGPRSPTWSNINCSFLQLVSLGLPSSTKFVSALLARINSRNSNVLR